MPSYEVLCEGLEPETAYHFRVVAKNGEGEAITGTDRVFATYGYLRRPTRLPGL